MDTTARAQLRRNPFGTRADDSPFQRASFLPGLNGHTGLITSDSYAAKSVESFFQNTGFFRPTPGGGESVKDAFTESWVVYVCATLLASKTESIPLQIWRSDEDEAEEVPETDPVATRLRRPNRDVTWGQFAARGVIHRKLSGEDIWFLMDGRGKPKVPADKNPTDTPVFDIPEQILNVTGSVVEDRRDSATGRITHWRYGGASTAPWFPSASIIHFADYDPSDPQRGLGAAEAAARQISIAFQAERYQEAVMKAGGPGGFLISKEKMGDENEAATQARMDDSSKDPQKAMRLKLLTGEWDVKPNPVAPKDMVALEHLRWARDVVAHLMHVPLAVIGVLDQSTYNNLDTAWREFWCGLRDYLNGVAEVMNAMFFPRLKGPASNYRCGFDFSKIKYLRDIDRADVELALKISQAGTGVSLNDALAALKVEIDPLPGGERQLIGAQYTDAETFDNPPDPPPDAPPLPPVAPPEPSKTLKLRHPALTDVKVRAQYHADWLIRAGVDRHERRLGLRVKGWLGAYERAQIARLRHFAENGHEGLEPNPSLQRDAPAPVQKITADDIERWLLLYKREWETKLSEATTRTIASAFESSLADAARELGLVSIDGSDPRVLIFLKDQEIKLVEGVTSTLSQRVRLQLMDVFQGATNTGDLQLAVKEMLPELTDRLRQTFGTKEARALVIARTETAHAANGAKFMQYRDAGVARIQWVSEGDDLVRESHRSVDGTIVDLGNRFGNGLVYPNDPNGPASEVANCRCGFVAVDEGE